MKTKVFKTIDEQISILQARGLIIDDIDFAKDTLIRENYFFINGYRHLFLKNGSDKNYKEGTNFSRCPEKQRQINDLIRKMKRQIRINGGQHQATIHYIKNYGYIPLWVVVKVLSFGIVSELYTIMKESDQEAIAEVYNVSKESLITYLPILANYRNLCAHEDIVYDHRTQKMIEDNGIHSYLDIPIQNGEYIYGKNDILALVIILKQLLADNQFRLFISELSYEIDVLAGRLHTIEIKKVLDAMGLPVNYKEIIRY